MSEVLTLQEVARYLKLSPDTVYRKAKTGEIPAVRVGKLWRFPKDLIDKWLSKEAGTAKGKMAPSGKRRRKGKVRLDPKKDPLLKLIGIADVESFADRIDEELYGD